MNMQAQFPKPWAQAGTQPKIAIIGAGMSGIAAVVKLRKAGYTDLTVFEKTDRVGGTWRENTYPGLTCDVPSFFYAYSFETNLDWSRRFSPGAEIRAYFERVADKYDLRSHIRFGSLVANARYDDGGWAIETGDGDKCRADVLVHKALLLLASPEGLEAAEQACRDARETLPGHALAEIGRAHV